MNGGIENRGKEAALGQHRLGLIISVAVFILGLAPAASASAGVGALKQKSGNDGCISETGTGGACMAGVALGGMVSLSPDGKNAYSTSGSRDAVAIFDRNPNTGALTQKPGAAGCISEDGTSGYPDFTSGVCSDGVALGGASPITVSPDGKTAYVGSADSNVNAIAIFDRNPNTGALIQKSGNDGCISETGTGGACMAGVALSGAVSISVSPDGKSIYAASYFSDAVSIFDRDPATGVLTQKAGAAGCISEDGTSGYPDYTSGACSDGKALEGVYSIAISPDGKSAYAASWLGDAVVIFDRDPATGALTQKPGTAGCISQTGTVGACATGVALKGAQSVVLSPAGTSVYVASDDSNAVVIFDRDPATGALTQKPGTAACISENGTGGFCRDGTALYGASSITLSADGKSIYAASDFSDAVSIFDRDPATGELTQKPGTAGCVSEDGTSGYPEYMAEACSDGLALDGPHSIIVSPDGENAYASSHFSDAIAVFDRSDGIGPTTTIESGPVGTTSDSTASFTFGADVPGSTFECGLDDESYGACASPQSYTDLADGSHTFNVRATDPADDIGGRASRSFAVDTTVDGEASAKRVQKQQRKTIVIEVRVRAAEDLAALASGRVTVRKSAFELERVSASVPGGGSAVLALRPAKARAAKKIADSLRRSDRKARIEVALADDAGNSKPAKLRVTLRA